MPRRDLADLRQVALAQGQAGPAAEHHPLRVEEIHQVRHSGAEIADRLVEHLGGGAAAGAQQLAEGALLVAAGRRTAPVGLPEPVQHPLRPDVRLQAAEVAAAAAAAPVHDGGVPPLAGAAVRAAVAHAVGDHAGPDAGTDQGDDRVPDAAPGAEPHLGLAERLGAVVDVHGDVGAGAQHGAERHAVPAEGLRVHHGVGGALDGAGDGDAEAEHRGRVDAGLLDHGGEALQQVVGDLPGVRLGGPDRVFRLGQGGHRQVEEFDLDPGLADVGADQVAVAGGDPEQHPGAATVGLDRAGLLDQALGDHLADQVAHAGQAERGGLPQLVPAQRAVQPDPGEQDRPVGTTHVAHGGASGVHVRRRPLPAAPRRPASRHEPSADRLLRIYI
ncbi:hypothetical protein B0E53_05877 [Micromonospora sp. MH33]|nr:hypothetical protein B0E53_05877 [Micromonospora sp. MH33]